MSRILWASGAPWVGSGYSQQTALFCPRIRDAGHDVAIAATWGLNGASIRTEDGILVYPEDEAFGNIRLADYAKLHNADVVITLHDVWILKNPRLRDLNLACWVPIDHEPCPPLVAGFLKEFRASPVAMSRFGEQMLKDQGFSPLYVPHGVDTSVFQPQDRAAARQMFGMTEDEFVVGMVAGNHGHTPSRKAFPQAVLAFSEFRREHENAVMYFHTEITGMRSKGNPGVNIPDLCDRYSIPAEAVRYTDQVAMDAGLPPEFMAQLYSSFDVLLNPSYGEGFGIPLIESQAVGTPVIATNWTSMPELVGSGWLVEGEPWDDVEHRAFYKSPSVPAIIEALEEAYTDAAGLREKAVEFAQAYDADRVFAEFWVPALEQLTKPREVGPLPNREMRRRQAKAKVGA